MSVFRLRGRLCIILFLSVCLHLVEPRPPQLLAVPKTQLTWVNGIAYNLQHMEEGKSKISEYFGGKEVMYCYNPTAMSSEDDRYGYVTDLAQAGTQKLGRTTGEVNALVKHLREAVVSVGKNGCVIHIAHSQGALLTSLAAKELTPLEMNQIEVLAFGGAAALRKTVQTPWRRVVNYYSVNDPLLLVVPPAAQALRQGYFVGASDSGDDFSSEFCFLAPRIGDPIQDHNLLGATYAQALAWEGQRFQNQYQSVAHRVVRSVDHRVTGPLWMNTMTGTLIIVTAIRQVLRTVVRMLLVPVVLILHFLSTLLQRVARMAIKAWGPSVLSGVVLLKAVLEDLVRSVNGQERYEPLQLALDLAEESSNKKQKPKQRQVAEGLG